MECDEIPMEDVWGQHFKGNSGLDVEKSCSLTSQCCSGWVGGGGGGFDMHIYCIFIVNMCRALDCFITNFTKMAEPDFRLGGVLGNRGSSVPTIF